MSKIKDLGSLITLGLEPQAHFRSAAEPPSATQSERSPRSGGKRATPFSLRLSVDERAQLEAEAGRQPLGSYIRERLLGPDAAPRRRQHRPQIDDEKLGRVLAALGASRLSQNLNQLAKASNMGTPDITYDTDRELQDACTQIAEIRALLVEALGLAPKA